MEWEWDRREVGTNRGQIPSVFPSSFFLRAKPRGDDDSKHFDEPRKKHQQMLFDNIYLLAH
jgi:hypothetical protein